MLGKLRDFFRPEHGGLARILRRMMGCETDYKRMRDAENEMDRFMRSRGAKKITYLEPGQRIRGKRSRPPSKYRVKRRWKDKNGKWQFEYEINPDWLKARRGETVGGISILK